MIQAIANALDKVTTAANDYASAVENSATLTADAAEQKARAESAAAEAETARTFEASELERLRTAVDELDAILTPPQTMTQRLTRRTA